MNRHYYDNGNPNGIVGVDFGCTTPAVTCFDDVIVTGSKLNIVNTIFSNIGSWTASQLESYVSANSTDLNDIIGSTETAGISNGTYSLRTRGSQFMSTRYLITKSGSTIISVTPISN